MGLGCPNWSVKKSYISKKITGLFWGGYYKNPHFHRGSIWGEGKEIPGFPDSRTRGSAAPIVLVTLYYITYSLLFSVFMACVDNKTHNLIPVSCAMYTAY